MIYCCHQIIIQGHHLYICLMISFSTTQEPELYMYVHMCLYNYMFMHICMYLHPYARMFV